MVMKRKNEIMTDIDRAIKDLKQKEKMYLLLKYKYYITKFNLAYLRLFKVDSKLLNMLALEDRLKELLCMINKDHKITSLRSDLKEFIEISLTLGNLIKEKYELSGENITEKTFYDIATLEEIDTYDKVKYQEEDSKLINKGLRQYKKGEGYLVDQEDIKDFIKELRNNFYTLIKMNNNITLDNIEYIFNAAYEMTIQKYETEPIVKPSMVHMLNYLRRHNQILIDAEDKSIMDSSKLYKEYVGKCFILFTKVMEQVTYIDIEEIEKLFKRVCVNVALEMNYFPEKPLALRKVLPRSLKIVQEKKMQK